MADENYHQGPTIDKGIAMPNSSGGGDERLQGLLSMKPLAKGAPTAARGLQAEAPITPELQKQMAKFPSQSAAIRAAQGRKR